MSFEMESWLKVCRCCLIPDATVSILDSNDNKIKFLEATAIEVSADDELPQRLCANCFEILNTAYEFRTQCQKMDKELRAQLDPIQPKVKIEYFSPNENDISEDVSDEYMKKLQSIIKSEPTDDDDDCYYVVVIDNKDDASIAKTHKPHVIKTEVMDVDGNDYDDNSIAEVSNSQENVQEMSCSQIDIGNTINSFLLSNTKVPTSVPATILENEEGHETEIVLNNNTEDFNDIDESAAASPRKVTLPGGIKEFNPKNLIKIVSPFGVEKTILLENDDTNFDIDDREESCDNDDAGTEQEIILCEGDDTSQFQILKVDGSEFVIEYADENH